MTIKMCVALLLRGTTLELSRVDFGRSPATAAPTSGLAVAPVRLSESQENAGRDLHRNFPLNDRYRRRLYGTIHAKDVRRSRERFVSFLENKHKFSLCCQIHNR